jgi:hypothetical protein
MAMTNMGSARDRLAKIIIDDRERGQFKVHRSAFSACARKTG